MTDIGPEIDVETVEPTRITEPVREPQEVPAPAPVETPELVPA